jgi:hypothetical protein
MYLIGDLYQFFIDSHSELSNHTAQMTVYSGGDFGLTNENPTDNTASTPTVAVNNSPGPTEVTVTKTPTGVPYASDLNIQGGDKTF